MKNSFPWVSVFRGVSFGFVWGCATMVIQACDDCPDESEGGATASDTDNSVQPTGGTETTMATSSTSAVTTKGTTEATGETGSGTSSGSTTSGAMFCDRANSKTECESGDFVNPETGGDCQWLPIADVKVDAMTCSLRPTNRGICLGEDGLDSGCTSSEITACNQESLFVTFRSVDVDRYELIFGDACRANQVAESCEELLLGPDHPGNPANHPCYCACDFFP